MQNRQHACTHWYILKQVSMGKLVKLIGILYCLADCSNPKKCRARYGVDQQSQWCKPCR